MADSHLIVRIEDLVRLAERNKSSRCHDAAKSAMREAQSLWEPRLGIPMPGFIRPQRPQLLEALGGAMDTRNYANEAMVHLSSQDEDVFTCPICTETRSGACYKHNACQNVFCCTCLDSWMIRSRTCPLCRADVQPIRI